MKKYIAMAIALVALLALGADPPALKTLVINVQYTIPPGGSNAVIVVYKSTSLGSVFTPYKPTCIFPATRTSNSFVVLPGLYHFYATAQVEPFGESPPSNICTNTVSP